MALAALVQLLYAVLADPPTAAGDQIDYVRAGEQFKTWWRDPNDFILRTPGYPLFLSGIFNAGGGLWAVRAVQIAGLTGVVLGSAWIACSISGVRAARIAAALVATHLPLLTYSSQYLTEALGITLFVAGLVLLLRAGRRGEPDWAAAAGAMTLLAAATLVRPSFVVVHVAAAGFLVLTTLGLRRKAAAAALVLLPVLVLFGPFAGRNLAIHGKPMPLGNGGKFPRALGVHLPFDTDVGQFSTLRRSQRFFTDTRPDGFDPAEASRVEPWDELFTNLRERPGELLRTRAVGQAQLWLWPVTARIQYGQDERVPYPLLMAHHLFLLATGLAGTIVLRRHRSAQLVAAIVVLIGASYLISFPQPRYVLPAVPLLAAMAGAGAVAVSRRRERSRVPA